MIRPQLSDAWPVAGSMTETSRTHPDAGSAAEETPPLPAGWPEGAPCVTGETSAWSVTATAHSVRRDPSLGRDTRISMQGPWSAGSGPRCDTPSDTVTPLGIAPTVVPRTMDLPNAPWVSSARTEFVS